MSGRRNGFVLIAALWLLVALGAVGLDVSLRSRSRRLAAANMVDETRARGAAFAGAEYARSRLTSAMLGRAEELRADAARLSREVQLNFSQPGRGGNVTVQTRQQQSSMTNLFRTADPGTDPWRDPEQLVATDTTFGEIPFSLHLRDTGAALNINLAEEVMIRQFLAQGLGLDYARADRLTQAMMDWRDDDDLPRINGGEREEYIEAGAPVLPPNRPFSEIDEVRYVLGMTPDVFDAMRPFLTIQSAGRINLNSAPEEVLNALPGMTQMAAQTFARQRAAGRYPRTAAELIAMMPSGTARSIQENQTQFNRRAIYTTDEVEITSEVVLEGSPIHSRVRAIVSRSPNGAVVVWRKVE